MWPKGLCGCDYVKDIEMGRLPWIIQVGPVQSQGSIIRGRQESHRRRCDNRSRGQSDKGPQVRGCRQATEGGKGKATLRASE